MTQSPNILDYGRWPHRRRWGLRIAAICIGLVVVASWYFRVPIKAWVKEAYADWRFARSFDAVQRELVSGNTYWLASAGLPERNERADQLLAQLLAQGPPEIPVYRTGDSNSVLFVRAGVTGGQRWLAFACIGRSGLAVYSFVRNQRSAGGYDRLFDTRTLSFGGAFNMRIRSMQFQGDSVTTAIDINGGANDINWTIVPSPGGRTQPMMGLSSAQVRSAARPGKGWVSSDVWVPNTGDFTLIEGAAADVELPGVSDMWGLSFMGFGRIATASTASVALIDVLKRKIDVTHSLPAESDRYAGRLESFVFSPNGERLFVGGTSTSAWLIDVVEGISRPFGQTAGRAMATFIDNQTLAVADNVAFNQIDWRSGRATLVRCLTDSDRPSAFGAAPGLWALSRLEDDSVHVRDANTDSLVAKFESPGPLRQASLSPCGRWLVLTGQDGMRLIDLRAKRILWRCDGMTDRANSCVKWTSDGRLGAVSVGQHVYVWCAGPAHWVARFPGRTTGDYFTGVALSPDGRSMAAIAYKSATVAYWSDLTKAIKPAQ